MFFPQGNWPSHIHTRSSRSSWFDNKLCESVFIRLSLEQTEAAARGLGLSRPVATKRVLSIDVFVPNILRVRNDDATFQLWIGRWKCPQALGKWKFCAHHTGRDQCIGACVFFYAWLDFWSVLSVSSHLWGFLNGDHPVSSGKHNLSRADNICVVLRKFHNH